VPLTHLATCAGVDVETLAELNPALQRDVISGRLHVPRGYRLWLPTGSKTSFQSAYASLPANYRYASQRQTVATHRVRSGQSLTQIAALYGTSVAALQRQNGLRSRSVRAGQVLRVPVAAESEPAVLAAASRRSSGSTSGSSASPRDDGAESTYIVHRVARGETLGQIAKRYGTSVSSLQRANGLSNVRKLQAGDRVKVPRSARSEASYRTHKVGPGQTLSQIADLYRTTVTNLQKVNGISDPSDIHHGQVLRIPM
jgi:membrane-bound lytic murein transglycosylase D